MPDTWNAKDGHPQIFDFYVKKRDLANLFDYFHSTVLFSVSFCLYRVVSLIWLLQIWVFFFQISTERTGVCGCVYGRYSPDIKYSGAPNGNFRKISVRKMIWDLEFSEHLL